MAKNRQHIPNQIDVRGQEPLQNRALERRRDEDYFSTPKVTIYDIDYAILTHLAKTLRIQIDEAGSMIDVPVQYGNGEKWSQIQRDGFLRDGGGQIMAPLIVIRNVSVSYSDRFRSLRPRDSTMRIKIKPTRSRLSQHDQINKVQNINQPQEFFVQVLPEFVDVSYEMKIWTEYIEQLNEILEQLIPLQGTLWGETWKFPTRIDDFSIETSVGSDTDRLVQASSNLTVEGFLIPEYQIRKSSVERSFTLKRIVFSNEVSSFDIRAYDGANGDVPWPFDEC